jgi:FkbM family methyltransferase
MSVKSKVRRFVKVGLQLVLPSLSVRRAIHNNRHEEPEVELLSALVQPDRIAIDVGANLGAYTNRLQSIARHVIAFEANPRLARVMSSAFPSVEVRNEAVSDKIGLAKLCVPLYDGVLADGLGSLEAVVDRKSKTIEISTIRLDQFCDADVGFLKVDVEGHEINVLNGARKLIEKQRPTVLVEAEERHKRGTIDSVFRYFDGLNYTGVFVFGKDLLSVRDFELAMQDPALVYSEYRRDGVFANNFIFIPSERYSASVHNDLCNLRLKSAPPTAPTSAEAIRSLAMRQSAKEQAL